MIKCEYLHSENPVLYASIHTYWSYWLHMTYMKVILAIRETPGPQSQYCSVPTCAQTAVWSYHCKMLKVKCNISNQAPSALFSSIPVILKQDGMSHYKHRRIPINQPAQWNAIKVLNAAKLVFSNPPFRWNRDHGHSNSGMDGILPFAWKHARQQLVISMSWKVMWKMRPHFNNCP